MISADRSASTNKHTSQKIEQPNGTANGQSKYHTTQYGRQLMGVAATDEELVL